MRPLCRFGCLYENRISTRMPFCTAVGDTVYACWYANWGCCLCFYNYLGVVYVIDALFQGNVPLFYWTGFIDVGVSTVVYCWRCLFLRPLLAYWLWPRIRTVLVLLALLELMCPFFLEWTSWPHQALGCGELPQLLQGALRGQGLAVVPLPHRRLGLFRLQ